MNDDDIEKLDALLLDADEAFARAGFKAAARVPLGGDYPFDLVWRKLNNEWTICVEKAGNARQDVGLTLLSLHSSALNVRIAAAARLGALWDACEEARGATAIAVRSALTQARDFLGAKGRR